MLSSAWRQLRTSWQRAAPTSSASRYGLPARRRPCWACCTADGGAQPVCCLRSQEVTPLIRSLLESAPWWCSYEASPASRQPYFTTLLWRRVSVAGARYSSLPFESRMGRDLKAVTGQVGGTAITVATSHLEARG